MLNRMKVLQSMWFYTQNQMLHSNVCQPMTKGYMWYSLSREILELNPETFKNSKIFLSLKIGKKFQKINEIRSEICNLKNERVGTCNMLMQYSIFLIFI